jgi:DNA helicase-2/ATP-dependent DNA helicase PcrA
MEKTAYKEQLNPRQYEAVTQPPGPLLVFAGAGSGKTRVLTYRIAYMIENFGINPREILAVTFTNKAAGEMRERLQQLLETDYLPLTVCTFHSFGARVLREYYEIISYRSNFSIYDDAESQTVIKNICKDFGMGDGDLNPRSAQYIIGRAKDEMISAEQFASQASSPRETDAARIYAEYQKRLLKLNAFDFDDLIYWPVKILETRDAIRKRLQNRFKHLLIDEYQDTSRSQYLLVKMLAEEHKSITAVGDDDQSIYSWRGADIANILNFERDFPGAKVVKLEQNYRSTQNILTAASGVIKNNRGRKKKVLWTEFGEGEKIRIYDCSDAESEALTVIDSVTRLRNEEGLRFSDFAILYRTNAQSRALEEGFRTSGIPYVIVGGIRFYERKEIKDMLAYLRILVNPDDDISTVRIINVPKRGIGDVTIDRIADYGQSMKINLLEACYHAAAGKIKGVPAGKIRVFTDIITRLRESVGKKRSPEELFREIFEFSGYKKALDDENTPESETRTDNINELIAGAAAFEERYPEATVEMFLEEVSLLTDIDRWDPDSDAVTLMTLHSAKGLEFPVVHITGLEEGLFPLQRSIENGIKDLEEERRLMYVGMTRAKRCLNLTYCHYRRRYNSLPMSSPSRFILEIPEDMVEKPADTMKTHVPASAPVRRTGRYGREAVRRGSFPLGTDVYHKKFGIGTVLSVEGSGDNEIVTVSFPSVGRKKLMVKFAGLEKAD